MRGYLDTNGTLEIHSFVLFVNLAHNTVSNIPKVTNQGTLIDSMQSAKSGFLEIWIMGLFVVLFIDRI